MLARYKHSSLLQKFVNYGQKMFFNIGPWSQVGIHGVDGLPVHVDLGPGHLLHDDPHPACSSGQSKFSFKKIIFKVFCKNWFEKIFLQHCRKNQSMVNVFYRLQL